jgi:thiol-disulfide isomerase/thioredoxin
MRKFLILLFLIVAVYTEADVAMPESNESNLPRPIEINDIDYLRSFLVEKKKAILEVYSPTCPHCMEFAPTYDELAKTVNIS